MNFLVIPVCFTSIYVPHSRSLSIISSFRSELVETQEDEMIKEVLENLMVHNDGTSGKTRASGISLQNIGQLRNQFSVKPFDLAILQSKVSTVLLSKKFESMLHCFKYYTFQHLWRISSRVVR